MTKFLVVKPKFVFYNCGRQGHVPLQFKGFVMNAQLGRQQTEKICVLIDNNALSLLFVGKRVNFKRLKEWLVSHREAVVAKVYCGELPSDDRAKFYQYLRNLGFEIVVIKHPRSRARSAHFDAELSGAISCQMSWDACELMSKGWYSSVVIVSGSFQLAEVCSRIRERGTEVEIVYPENSTSPTLRGRATVFRSFPMDCLQIVEEREKVLQ